MSLHSATRVSWRAPLWRGIDTVLYVTEGLGFKVKMLAVSAWTGYKFVIVVTAI